MVVRFNHQKGYGFIKPNNGGENLFVRYSDVKSEGFLTLHKDLSVEFTVQTDEANNKKKAVEVTGINGSEIKIVRKSVSRGSGRDSDGIGDCYNCGQPGHMARDCSNASWCSYCPKNGHKAKGCTYVKSGGDGASYNCYNCGGSGHFARDCTITHSNRGGACYNYEEQGHLGRECPKGAFNGGSGGAAHGGGRRGGSICFLCWREKTLGY